MSKPICDEDFLHCENRKIVNKSGSEIHLRGTNLGGWLLQEEWMAAVSGIDSQWEIVSTLEKRFGYEKMSELISEFEDNYITEDDIDRLAKAGFTCLRVPFWYKNIYRNDDGTADFVQTEEPDFSRLDMVCKWCADRGIYVILDMHGVPGHQSIAHHSCRTDYCKLYDDTSQGSAYRKKAASLWSRIAAHFADNPAVAAYDLMNEPMCDYHGRQKVNSKYIEVYKQLYNAVREQDSRHIITLEAIWTPFDIKAPKHYGWENVMYQYHLYLPNDAAYSAFVPIERLRRFNVPVLIGEFAPCRGKASWEHILKVFNKAGYNWLTWTYKGHCKSGGKSDWFITGTNNAELSVDIKTAAYEEILEKWGRALRTENGCSDMAPIGLIGKYAKQ